MNDTDCPVDAVRFVVESATPSNAQRSIDASWFTVSVCEAGAAEPVAVKLATPVSLALTSNTRKSDCVDTALAFACRSFTSVCNCATALSLLFCAETLSCSCVIGMLSSWTTGFASFVDANRELYRFLRKEGVMDVKWEVPRGEWSEPIADNIGGSLAAIFADRGVDRATALTWGYALVGMVGGALEWWVVTHDRDRLEIERDLGRLTAAALRGLLAAAPRAAKRGRTREPAKKPARRPRARSR